MAHEWISGTGQSFGCEVRALADNTLLTSGTIYGVLYDATVGKYWDGAAWQASLSTVSMTHLAGGHWRYSAASGAYVAGSDMVLLYATDQSDGTASSTYYSCKEESAVCYAEDRLVTADIPNSGGVSQVTITVNDEGASPIENVTVDVYDSGNTTKQRGCSTDANGQCTFAIDDGSYKVRLSRSGYQFTTPETLTVSGDTSDTYAAVSSYAVGASATTYEQRRMGRNKVRYNSANDDNPLTYQLVVNGAKVTPTSATITIYAPGSTTALVSAAAMTVSGTLLTYALDTTTTASWPKDTGYRADIVVTYNSKTYDRHLMFDVVGYLLDINIAYDQLVALDDSLRDMTWDGNEDFARLVEAFRDVLQVQLESRVTLDGKLLENLILDSTPIAVAARYGIIAQIYRSKKLAEEKVAYYQDTYQRMLDAALSTLRFDDTGQSGSEMESGGQMVAVELEL